MKRENDRHNERKSQRRLKKRRSRHKEKNYGRNPKRRFDSQKWMEKVLETNPENKNCVYRNCFCKLDVLLRKKTKT